MGWAAAALEVRGAQATAARLAMAAPRFRERAARLRGGAAAGQHS